MTDDDRKYFLAALNGVPGQLDAWLECRDEAEVREAILDYAAAYKKRQEEANGHG